MDYKALMRRKLLEQMYDKLSDEEKKVFVHLSMQDKDHREIMEALDKIRRGQSWWLDLSSNIVGNAIYDGFAWLASRVFRKL